METLKKLMEEIQTGENDFFDEFDKFACTQEVFDLIKKLPNFKLADPTTPESGYFNGKPIYVHPACTPNTLMGMKTLKEPLYEAVYMCPGHLYPITFQTNPKTTTGFCGGTSYETKGCRKIRLRNKPNMYTVVKVLAGIMIPLVVGAILFALFTI